MNPGIVLLLGLLVLVYMNVAARRRTQRDRAALQQRLVPGAQVVTTSGLHATVTEVAEDDTVLLESAPGHVTRWEKMAVGRIVDSPADEVPAADEEPAADGETAEPADTTPSSMSAPTPEPAGEFNTDPTAEPGARPLPGTAPPDRA